MTKFKIIRDIQEKVGFWNFLPDEYCAGTTESHLKTGDYTIEGYEEYFMIERKRNSGEVAGNWGREIKRWEREMERANEMRFPFVIFEFNFRELISFPSGSGIPPKLWPSMKIRGPLLVKRFIEFQCNYPNVRFLFAGNRENAQKAAMGIFKNVFKELLP